MSAEQMRVALYWAPAPADPLHAAGSAWLGRDAETGEPVAQPDVPGLAEVSAAPARYGFHATLRPPMPLATGWAAFLGDATRLAGAIADFPMPPLEVADLDGFLALVPRAACPPLRNLADRCVAGSEAHRRPAGAAELARRRRAGLTPAEEAMLVRWGYPYVLDEWRFHITLTRRLTAVEMAGLRPAAARHFEPALALPRRAGSVCVFTETGAGANLVIAARLPLAGRNEVRATETGAAFTAAPDGLSGSDLE